MKPERSFNWVIAAVVMASFCLYHVAWCCAANEPATTAKDFLYTGDKLKMLRERAEGQKFDDKNFKTALVDRQKGLSSVLFRVSRRDGKIETIEVSGVPEGQTESKELKVLKPEDKDLAVVKRLLKLSE